MKCSFCPREIDPNSRAVLWEIIGWGKKRDQGGQNRVRFPKPTGRAMCSSCEVDFRYTGGQGKQMALFEP